MLYGILVTVAAFVFLVASVATFDDATGKTRRVAVIVMFGSAAVIVACGIGIARAGL
jgi:hypothetical protein